MRTATDKPPLEWLARGGYAARGVVHVIIGWLALVAAFGGGRTTGSRGAPQSMLGQPFGKILLAIVAVSLAFGLCGGGGAGVAHVWKGWHATFDKHLRWSDDERRLGRPICRFALVMRGIAFIIIGGFFIIAAWQADPDEARGLSGTLQALQQQSYGFALLGVMAIGLVAFGLYSLIESVYRNVEPEG
ncbi:MAG: DUF1206 domain-containing protein [Alphaproteobacteria bacterium]